MYVDKITTQESGSKPYREFVGKNGTTMGYVASENTGELKETRIQYTGIFQGQKPL